VQAITKAEILTRNARDSSPILKLFYRKPAFKMSLGRNHTKTIYNPAANLPVTRILKITAIEQMGINT